MPLVALVVDDSMLIRHTVCRFLEERGFTVECATNGQDAVEALAPEFLRAQGNGLQLQAAPALLTREGVRGLQTLSRGPGDAPCCRGISTRGCPGWSP